MAPRTIDGTILRWAVLCDGVPVSQRKWLEALRHDDAARRALTEVLRAAPFRAYLWETPAVSPAGDRVTAEMAVIARPELAPASADPSAFAAAFDGRDTPIATFANRGGDALLVAPHPAHAPHSSHLAEFVRTATDEIVDALWIAVSIAVSEWLRVRNGAVWVSTSGLAVPWLHVRLDPRPKYYAYAAYKIAG